MSRKKEARRLKKLRRYGDPGLEPSARKIGVRLEDDFADRWAPELAGDLVGLKGYPSLFTVKSNAVDVARLMQDACARSLQELEASDG